MHMHRPLLTPLRRRPRARPQIQLLSRLPDQTLVTHPLLNHLLLALARELPDAPRDAVANPVQEHIIQFQVGPAARIFNCAFSLHILVDFFCFF